MFYIKNKIQNNVFNYMIIILATIILLLAVIYYRDLVVDSVLVYYTTQLGLIPNMEK